MTPRTLRVLLLVGLGWVHAQAAPSGAPETVGAPGLMRDPGFESVPAGPQAATGMREGWEVQRTGRDVILDRLLVACVADASRARSGRKCLSLSIPKDTVGFEFVTVGHRVRLAAGKEYEASVWVRWPAGPDAAPRGAAGTATGRSAIISFWARHREGTGHFAGRDVWLVDNRWRRLDFRFRPPDPDQRTLVYLSLLPNQTPADTTVLIDDFNLTEHPDAVAAEPRKGNIVRDSDFGGQRPGAVGPPWSFANMGGTRISGRVVEQAGGRVFIMAMGEATSNFESAQLWQHVDLREGARYEVSCRMRWDNFAPGAPAPIVNYGIYHEPSGTWYGPVDQVLEKTKDWKTYRFSHIPPFGGRWKLYVQLNGWGNFGKGVTVSLDDFTCVPK